MHVYVCIHLKISKSDLDGFVKGCPDAPAPSATGLCKSARLV